MRKSSVESESSTVRGIGDIGGFREIDVSQAIPDAYYTKFGQALRSDAVIVGAGPSGLVAAWRLAKAQYRVVVQKEALSILDEVGVRHQPSGCLFTADAMELASALCLKACNK